MFEETEGGGNRILSWKDRRGRFQSLMKIFDSQTRKEDARSFRHFYTLLTHTWSLAVSPQSFPKSPWWEDFSQTCISLNLLSQHSRGRSLWVPGQRVYITRSRAASSHSEFKGIKRGIVRTHLQRKQVENIF